MEEKPTSACSPPRASDSFLRCAARLPRQAGGHSTGQPPGVEITALPSSRRFCPLAWHSPAVWAPQHCQMENGAQLRGPNPARKEVKCSPAFSFAHNTLLVVCKPFSTHPNWILTISTTTYNSPLSNQTIVDVPKYLIFSSANCSFYYFVACAYIF